MQTSHRKNFFVHYWPSFAILVFAAGCGALAYSVFNSQGRVNASVISVYSIVFIIGLIRGFMLGFRSERGEKNDFFDRVLIQIVQWVLFTIFWPAVEVIRQFIFLVRAAYFWWSRGEILVSEKNPDRVVRWV
jgi:hypothetical protein